MWRGKTGFRQMIRAADPARFARREHAATIAGYSNSVSTFGVNGAFQTTAQRSNAPDDAIGFGVASVVFTRRLSVRENLTVYAKLYGLARARDLGLKTTAEGVAALAGATAARDLMKRPVCMMSNIHSVLFAPETLELMRAMSAAGHSCHHPPGAGGHGHGHD